MVWLRDKRMGQNEMGSTWGAIHTCQGRKDPGRVLTLLQEKW
jgi:hypothetical protein